LQRQTGWVFFMARNGNGNGAEKAERNPVFAASPAANTLPRAANSGYNHRKMCGE
jgi:hypothetical protein